MEGGYKMKYKRIIFISLLLLLISLLCLFALAQDYHPPLPIIPPKIWILVGHPLITWDRTYGGSGNDLAWSLIQTIDGYVVAGGTESKGSGGQDFWVIKLDKQGNQVWDRTYGGSGNDWANSFIQTNYGGYVVAGGTESKGAGGFDFWVIELWLYEQGNQVWDKTYGGSADDRASSLIQTTVSTSSNWGYAVAGYTKSKGAGDFDFWVIKLDEKGNLK